MGYSSTYWGVLRHSLTPTASVTTAKTGLGGAVTAVSARMEGDLFLTAGSDLVVRFWDPRMNRCLAEYEVHGVARATILTAAQRVHMSLNGEGILCAAFHPVISTAVAGGADSVISVFR